MLYTIIVIVNVNIFIEYMIRVLEFLFPFLLLVEKRDVYYCQPYCHAECDRNYSTVILFSTITVELGLCMVCGFNSCHIAENWVKMNKHNEQKKEK